MQLKWGTNFSFSFTVTNGVRQRRVLIPYLFAAYLDELSEQLGSVSVGCTVGNMTVNQLMFTIVCQCMLANCGANTHRASMKCLCAAYNNAHRIMYCIPRNVGVRPHQVSHRVMTLDTSLRTNLYRFLEHCASSSNFFIPSLKCLMFFTNFRFSSLV